MEVFSGNKKAPSNQKGLFYGGEILVNRLGSFSAIIGAPGEVAANAFPGYGSFYCYGAASRNFEPTAASFLDRVRRCRYFEFSIFVVNDYESVRVGFVGLFLLGLVRFWFVLLRFVFGWIFGGFFLEF